MKSEAHHFRKSEVWVIPFVEPLAFVRTEKMSLIPCFLLGYDVRRVSDSLCAGVWFTSSPRIGRGKPRLVG